MNKLEKEMRKTNDETDCGTHNGETAAMIEVTLIFDDSFWVLIPERIRLQNVRIACGWTILFVFGRVLFILVSKMRPLSPMLNLHIPELFRRFDLL